ncbi:MAG: hypothetical protein NC548_64510 [Lachnospiraceae bacterium]|nr:hypothetical protein [Lachnospiraceae bacterium]
MIKPVTFQGQFYFNANLYALEVKSRFIDQNNAHGYYTGYGDELDAKIVGGNKIQIGTGAFVVCGRMSEITAAEIVQPQIFDGFKGYVVARIETYHPADENNCTIIAKIQTDWAALDRELEQNDVYAATADNVNTAYELPIYSFEISGTQITKLTRLIKPVCDYATIKTIVDNALQTAANAVATANNAVSTANAANTKSDNAVSTANAANSKSDAAVETANTAASDAAAALSTANALDGQIKSANTTAANAVTTANEAKAAADQATADVADLAEQIAEGQGTSVTIDGVPQATFPADGLLRDGDEFNATTADNATHADSADTATEAEAAAITTYAHLSGEAEKAAGYTRGGEIDKKLKEIEARLSALE